MAWYRQVSREQSERFCQISITPAVETCADSHTAFSSQTMKQHLPASQEKRTGRCFKLLNKLIEPCD